MAMDLVDIRVILSGGKEVAAEADAAAASIGKTGDAAKKANEESGASAKKASGAIKKSSASTVTSLKKTTSAMKTVGGSLTKYVTAPILAIGGASVVMGLNFERSVQRLHTQAGVAKRELPGLEKYFLHVARLTTSSPTEASETGYRLAGSGLKGKRLKEATLGAAQLAMVGGGNTEETGKVLGQLWYSEIEGAENFKHVIAELNATVGAGDLKNVGTLIDAFGTGVPKAAQAAGLNLRELNAVMAVFGDTTTNVSGYAAQFSTGLHYFTSPGTKASEAMEAMGLNAGQLSTELAGPRGLVTMLTTLNEHLEKLPGGKKGVVAKQLLGEILPGGKGRIFGAVLLNSIDKLEEKEKRIGEASGLKSWLKILHETEKNPKIGLENAWSNIQADLVELGKVIIPVLIPAIHKLSDWIQSAAEWFKNLSPHAKKVVLILAVFAALLGPGLILLAGFVNGMIALGIVMSGVSGLVILTIVSLVALGAAFYLAYHKVKWFREGVDWVVNAMGGVVNAVSYVIFSFSPLAAAVTMVVGHFKWLKNAFENVVNWFETSSLGKAIVAPFKVAVEWIGKTIEKIEAIYGKVKEVVEFAEGLNPFGGGSKYGQSEQTLHEASENAANGMVEGPGGKVMPGYSGPRHPPRGTTKALRLHNARIQTSTSTGTAPVNGPRERGGDTHIVVMMPNGKVLAEEVKKANDDAGARNNG